jgi:flagellar assembly factor FliW
MPVLETNSFGPIPYEPDAVLEFPCGLPAFETRRRFVALRFPHSEPLVFLQSLEDPGLCFITLPVGSAAGCISGVQNRVNLDSNDKTAID